MNCISAGDTLALCFKDLYKYERLFQSLDWLHLQRRIRGFLVVVNFVYSHVQLYRFECVKTCTVTNKSKRFFPSFESRVKLVVVKNYFLFTVFRLLQIKIIHRYGSQSFWADIQFRCMQVQQLFHE